ncbi:MAG: hypothetical protein ACM3JD_00890 [Rudaea sp.]
MALFYLAAVLGALLAALYTRSFLRSFRRPYESTEPLLRWADARTWFWQLDGMWTAFLILHNLCLLLLVAEFLAVCERIAADHSALLPGPLNSPLLPSWFISPVQQALFIFAAIGVAIVTYNLGATLSALLLPRYAPRLPYTILEQGLAAGQHLLAWGKFSHWKGDNRGRSIRLYSSVSPTLATVRLHLETGDLYRRAAALLAEHLPSRPSAAPVPFTHQRWTLVGRLLAVALPLLLIGLALYLHRDYWAWYYYDIAGWILIGMGYRAPKALGAL